MKYYHSIFKQLHFDYGKMLWSINHIPFFGTLLSVCDNRGIGSMHSITFFAFLKVITDGKILRKQADAIFSLLDVCNTGEISFSEITFWAGIIVAQKDHLEREFLYMHAWKIWVTFNDKGAERVKTPEFRKTGLFFDFDYPSIFNMYREYNWDEDKPLEFERFRFYLISCIHFRTLRRANAKYLRYKKFKQELLDVLHAALIKVLRENLYPAPTAILRAIRSIRIPPIEGQEMVYHWSDVFTLHWMRNAVSQQWELVKLRMLELMHSSMVWTWICKYLCCEMCCIALDEEEKERIQEYFGECTRYTWNFCCIFCCFGWCGLCFIPKEDSETHDVPMKPVILRRDIDLKELAEIEKHKDMFEPTPIEYHGVENEWDQTTKQKKYCSIQ